MDDYPHIATAVGSWLWNEHNSFWPSDREIDFFLFCQDFLSGIYVSPSVIFLGLKYLQRYLNNQVICHTNERQLFAVSIRLAYKYLEDDSLCPRIYPWSTISRTSSLDLLHLEQQFLLSTAYDLSLTEYIEWVDHCRSIAANFCLNPAILYYPNTIPLFGSSSAAPALIYGNVYNDSKTTTAANTVPMEDEDDEDEDEEDDYESPISISIAGEAQQEQTYNLTSQPIDVSTSALMGTFDNADSSALVMSMMALASSEAATSCFANSIVFDGYYYDQYYCCPPDMIYPPLDGHCDENLVATPSAVVHDYNYCRLSGDSLLFQPYYYPAFAPPLPNPAMTTDEGH